MKNRYKNKIFEEKYYYVFYVEKSRKQSEILSNQEVVKTLGGSGEIYFENDLYYLTASVYLSKDDSIEILKSTREKFLECGIINLKRKKVSYTSKVKIRSNYYAYKYLNYLDNLVTLVCDNELLYLSGNMTPKTIISCIMKQKIELDNIIKHFIYEENDDIFENMFQNQNLCLFYLNNFLTVFFESSKKDSLVCSLAINLVLTLYDFYKLL